MMKTTFKTYKIIALILLSCTVLYNCSSEDDQTENTIFNITLDQTDYSTTFYQDGQTQPLVINSNLDAPMVISIDGNPEYLFYDQATSTINGTKALPIGITEATIRAIAGSEEATINVSIKNVFEGVFSGGTTLVQTDEPELFDTEMSFQINTNNKFSMISGMNNYEGQWTMDANNTVTISIINTSSGMVTSIFQGTLSYSEIQAPKISGIWYAGNTIVETAIQGYFFITLEQ